uniref:Uncharacterized protein n=1 Tax=Rhizophora mucronata TaxID=61149 RepID=A0A2P2QIR9_RHIMU
MLYAFSFSKYSVFHQLTTRFVKICFTASNKQYSGTRKW